jgi:prepilin-type N-terminal cleavage/methylation domain-containing protein
MNIKQKYGFTLPELLIALGILGVIAVFAIPKILSAS